MQAGQTGDGAGGADQMGAAGVEGRAHHLGLAAGGDVGLHRLDHGAVPAAAIGVVLGETFGQGDHADGNGGPCLHRQALGREAARIHVQAAGGEVHPRQLGRAAADVDHQGRLGLAVEQVEAAGHGQMGLLAGGDDLQADAGLLAHPADEGLAVVGRAAGLGRHRPHLGAAAAGDLLGADLQRLHRAVHCRGGQASALGEALAQANDVGIGLDDAEAVRRRPRYQQPAVVGAEIERREGGGVFPIRLTLADRRRGAGAVGRPLAPRRFARLGHILDFHVRRPCGAALRCDCNKAGRGPEGG
jgi:hypothetical protein